LPELPCIFLKWRAHLRPRVIVQLYTTTPMPRYCYMSLDGTVLRLCRPCTHKMRESYPRDHKCKNLLVKSQIPRDRGLHPFLRGYSRLCRHRLRLNLDKGDLRNWARRSGPLRGCPLCSDERRISESSVRNRREMRGGRCVCLENGQKMPMAHPNSSEQAGTVFHGRWGGKDRLLLDSARLSLVLFPLSGSRQRSGIPGGGTLASKKERMRRASQKKEQNERSFKYLRCFCCSRAQFPQCFR
jgi:hypothetical protein